MGAFVARPRRLAVVARIAALVALGSVLSPARPGRAQVAPYDSTVFAALKWREIGIFRGGRSVAVAGSAARPNEYWMGTTGGGVFKTTDGGNTWLPATDKYFGGTIGAIGVSESNPDVVYVGTGEYPIRGNVSHGDGVYKTSDGGATWRRVLFRNDSTGICDLVLDPSNPDVLYAAFWQAQRKPWQLISGGAGGGIFKSSDGGETWTEL